MLYERNWRATDAVVRREAFIGWSRQGATAAKAFTLCSERAPRTDRHSTIPGHGSVDTAVGPGSVAAAVAFSRDDAKPRV